MPAKMKKRKKVERPPLPDAVAKRCMFSIRMTTEMFEKVTREMENPREFVRQALFNKLQEEGSR